MGAKTKSINKTSTIIKKVNLNEKKSLLESLYFYLGILILMILSVTYGLTLQQNNAGSKQQVKLNNIYAKKAAAQILKIPLLRPTISSSPSATPTIVTSHTASPSSALSDDGATVTGSRVNGIGYCLYVPVFMYHHIEPMAQANEEGHGQLTVDSNLFDQQMGYMIAHGYNFISLSTLVNAIVNHQSLPAKTVVLTADDGYIDIYQYAYPIIQKYHIIMNLFIPTGLIDNSDYMTWNQIKQMQGSGLVNIYNHTWSHYPLGQGDKTKITFEMQTSQNELKQNLGLTPNIMAYPYGSFSPLSIQVLQSEGFTAAFSTLPGTDECTSNLMTEPRYRIGNAPMSYYGF